MNDNDARQRAQEILRKRGLDVLKVLNTKLEKFIKGSESYMFYSHLDLGGMVSDLADSGVTSSSFFERYDELSALIEKAETTALEHHRPGYDKYDSELLEQLHVLKNLADRFLHLAATRS